MLKSTDIAIFLFTIIPQNLLSRLFGLITRIPVPQSIMKALISWYSKKFAVIEEYRVPESGFTCFDKFFTRELKPDARPVPRDKKSIISPVDARIDQYGLIKEDSIIQAKGIYYSVRDLVPISVAEKFINGSFITLYLSPGDYHRIHSPVSGSITGYLHIPGRLFTVQEYMANGLNGLFTRNERLITFIESKGMPVAVCKIGAMNVGRITVPYDTVSTNKFFRKKTEKAYTAKTLSIQKGDEIGTFHLGSTVILLFPQDFIKFNSFNKGHLIKMGEPLGVIVK
ncbi:MAG TPA: archaetidylserine decarboxylase [Spirochaetota bacterium]|nr:archaetidylserine decarboxylase [Spirochaetota bacterium]HPR47107.1 archaetidylserine decarboxylase [Spirochaetota bacterium]